MIFKSVFYEICRVILIVSTYVVIVNIMPKKAAILFEKSKRGNYRLNANNFYLDELILVIKKLIIM